jgi:hypothetical protein
MPRLPIVTRLLFLRTAPALTLACLSGCGGQPSSVPATLEAAPGASGAMEGNFPPRLADEQTPSSARVGGQTGSGGLPMGFACDQIARGACEESLQRGFGATQTPLALTASECVPASAVDPALSDAPVCRCVFTSRRYFSDTGDTFESAYTIGLASNRATASEPGDGCEVWFQNNPASGVCLLESSAFSGCSLSDPASSCLSSCATLAARRDQAVARERGAVGVAAAACVECNSGYCFGVLHVGDRCFSGRQYSLGFGYYPRSIACEGSPEDQLRSIVEEWGCSPRDAGAQPLPPAPGDAGLPTDAGMPSDAGRPSDAAARPASDSGG